MDHTELNEKLKDWEEHLLHYRLPLAAQQAQT